MEYNILKAFEKTPNKEFSTLDILKQLKPEDFKRLELCVDKKEKKNVKRELQKEQRKLLYYLNKLISKGILKCTRMNEKGEKFYKINLQDGKKLEIDSYERSITIEKPLTTPIEGFEEQRIIRKFEEKTWFNKLNSILIASSKFNQKRLYETVNILLANVNDVIGLNDLETVNVSREFFKRLEDACQDYNKRISCIIDLTNAKKDIIKTIRDYAEVNPKRITLIFDLSLKEFHEHQEVMDEAIRIFSKRGMKLYVKNNDIHDAPYMLGEVGPYTFTEEEWSQYRGDVFEKTIGIACSQSAITVDVKRFFRINEQSLENFQDFIMKITQSLLAANALQRKNSQEYFREIVRLNGDYAKEFFSLSKNYIRFWNYGWKEPSINQKDMIEMLKKTKKKVNDFATSEEIIYKSCGMPTRFKIAFSCAFKGDALSAKNFHQINITKLEDLYDEDMVNVLQAKEEIFRIFDGGDRMRFYRGKTPSTREINVILTSYKIPFFCYDFTNNNFNLSHFIK